MQQFNFPTTILFGDGSLQAGCKNIAQQKIKKPLLVTDKNLNKVGLVDEVMQALSEAGIEAILFDQTHPNPIEDDISSGVSIYKKNNCDSLIALGGGSPMDAAKVIAIMVNHPEPLIQYDVAQGGDQLINGEKFPPIFAIPTTAGTGSEVGRGAVIIMKDSGNKTIFFHPNLIPKIAILEPRLLEGLPPHLTAATGIDAFTHSLEAFLAPAFHPMADGIAKESMELILGNLAGSVKDGHDLNHRGKMLMASTMGATAFQKGLGMIHALAHPLSSECGLHHGLANALVLPASINFLEESSLNPQQRDRIDWVISLFNQHGYEGDRLSLLCENYFKELGIQFGLHNHQVKEEQLESLSQKAFEDGSHQTNMIPVTQEDLLHVLERAY